eukprot:m.36823 g.36823  ORF g.36823 m.36823 type:complete len:85 (-) comp12898_c0_seq1:19-273(-)
MCYSIAPLALRPTTGWLCVCACVWDVVVHTTPHAHHTIKHTHTHSPTHQGEGVTAGITVTTPGKHDVCKAAGCTAPTPPPPQHG